MDTIGSIVTITLVLAVIFVPQAMAIYFADWRKAERDEFVTDGR